MDTQAIVNTMEVLEAKPINELVTEVTIKVCYVSETPNRNGTVINKEVGRQIAATLPGAPVVGLFDETTGDFVEHSRSIEIVDGVVKMRDITRPYGFVSFDQPWYQDFMENGVVRTYLMCKAYLWTRQYAEASLALNKGQSMELNENTLSGYYEGDVFVFTQATLDKLCILGDAYAPCFEGASIMSTYALQYNDFAAQVEQIIGRRYYVMNGKLEQKPDKITLEYAVQLGWNLTDAVYNQLYQRGCQNYAVEGIYSEGGVIFAIIQDVQTLEYLRVDIEITSQDTVELKSEMVAVTQSWVPKTPAEPEPVASLGNDPANASQDPASTLSSQPEPAPAPESGPAPGGVNNFTEESEPAAEEPTTEYAAEPAEATEPPVAEEPTTEYNAEPAAEVPAEEPANEESAGEPASEYVAEPAAEVPATEEPVEASVTVEYTDLAAKNAELEAQVAELQGKISSLEASLSAYTAAEEAANEQKKNDLLNTYKLMLTDEEIQPCLECMSSLTVDELEARLAVTYARKQQKQAEMPTAQFQLNIGSLSAEGDSLPDFMKQAMEIDKQLRGGITLKA